MTRRAGTGQDSPQQGGGEQLPSARDARKCRAAASTAVGAALLHAGGAIEYRIVRSARRRRTLEIAVDETGVRVSVPLRTPLGEIDEFVRQRIPWILEHRRSASPIAPPAFASGETLPYQGRALTLAVGPALGRTVTVEADLLDLRLGVPAGMPAAGRRERIERAVVAWYAARAREAVEASIERWAPVIGRRPARLVVRDQRRRWGSCGPDGTLRFNWRLAMFEPALLDYVVVHELAHLEQPNHGAGFWAIVDGAMPDHRERRKRLREAALRLPAL